MPIPRWLSCLFTLNSLFESTSLQVNKSTSQQVNESTSLQVYESTSQRVYKSTSLRVYKSTSIYKISIIRVYGGKTITQTNKIAVSIFNRKIGIFIFQQSLFTKFFADMK